MPSITVKKLEERWTPTTIQSGFVVHSLPGHVPKLGGISIDLPLLNLGWTFALVLSPQRPHKSVIQRRVRNWIPAALSFRQHGNTIRWGNTSICAQLSLGEGSNLMPLGTINVALADTPSSELPLSTRCTISSFQPNKVWLTVMISECPLPNGLFEARFDPVNEAEVQAQLVRQSGDRLLGRSLATGKLFDVKFLAFPTRYTSGSIGEPLPTYASLSVLEKHINLSSSILKERWIKALDNTKAKRVGEILCPKDYEYEEDSDFEDEDEISSPPINSGCQHDPDLVVSEGQRPENGTERSGNALSSFELEVSDRELVDYQHEEVIKHSSELLPDYERTIWIQFAAHRTWHAFLWYCYTGNLEFSKLKSQVEPGSRLLRVTPLEGGPPTCSPKSMYRLADLVGDNDLKGKALVAIKERMIEANVLDETFSVFTSKYPDVREVQLGVLMEHCGSPKVKKAFLGAVQEFNSMPHAKPVLSAFYDNLVA